jgi:hypothetical protein
MGVVRTTLLTVIGIVVLCVAALLAMRNRQKKSQAKQINVVSQNGSFSIMQGEVDGHALFASIDMRLRDLADKQRLPFFLSLSTTLTNPTSKGLPTQSDADNLNAWEEAVEARVKSASIFVFVGRVTWNGHRELLYYVGDQQSTIETLKTLPGTRPFAFTCERDEKWKKADFWFNHPQ